MSATPEKPRNPHHALTIGRVRGMVMAESAVGGWRWEVAMMSDVAGDYLDSFVVMAEGLKYVVTVTPEEEVTP